MSIRSLLAPALVSSAALSAQDSLYYTTAEVLQELQAVAAAHPAIATVVDLTTFPGASVTHDGNSIWALKVSDQVAVDEDEPSILIASQHHARELNTPHMVIGAIHRVVAAYGTDSEITAAVDGYEIWFVPTVNPDGVDWIWSSDPNWRKNRRDNGDGTFGVDLNRNYPYLWDGSCRGSTNTSRSTYRGPSPGSEPETVTILALVEQFRPEIYIDFHSFGREVLTTYAPCSSATTTVLDLIGRYADDLRTPMNYDIRAPSASGEAPEDLWNRFGALSYLIEVGDSFQPPFAETVAEEARVWPGLRRMLTSWEPALRGHVRSLFGSTPVEASIDISPDPFTAGESRASRGRDGRYHLWLPLGTWDVTFSAPGFVSETRTIAVASYDAAQDLEVVLIPDLTPASLTKFGSDRLGTSTSLTYTSPEDAGRLFWIALSAGDSPGIQAGPRTIPLEPDPLFFASSDLPALITSNIGVMPPGGSTTAMLHVPDLPILVGLELFAAGITLEDGWPLSVRNWSPSLSIVFQP